MTPKSEEYLSLDIQDVADMKLVNTFLLSNFTVVSPV